MAQSSAIRAGKAFVELFTDPTKLERGLAQASAKLKAWGASISGLGVKIGAIGAAITAPLLGAVGLYTEMASELGKVSQRTGMSIESISSLGAAAKMSGVDMETLEKGIRKMQVSIYKASQGSEESQKSFRDLGLSAQQLGKMAPEDQLKTLADRISQIQNPTKKTAEMVAIFGKAGTELAPLLNRGSAGIQELTDKARRLGLVMNNDDVAAARNLKGAWKELKASGTSVAISIGSALAPLLADLVKQILPYAQGVAAWVKENKGLAITLFKVGAGIAGVGLALVVLGKGFNLLATGFGMASSVLRGAIGLFSFLTSPIGLVVLALAGLTVAAIAWSGEWGNMVEDGKQAWQGIVDAVMSGDLELAMRIAWAGIKILWLRGTSGIKILWAQATTGLAMLWNEFAGRFELGWLRITSSIKDAWDATTTAMAKGLLWLVDQIPESLRELVGLGDFKPAEAMESLDKDREETKKKNEEDYQKKGREITERREGINEALAQGLLEEQNAIANQIKGAQEELNKLTQEAADKRAAQQEQVSRAAAATPPGLGGPGSSLGSFSLTALRGALGGESVQQEQLRQQQQININLGRVHDAIESLEVGTQFS